MLNYNITNPTFSCYIYFFNQQQCQRTQIRLKKKGKSCQRKVNTEKTS